MTFLIASRLASTQVTDRSGTSSLPRPAGIYYGASTQEPRGLVWLLRFGASQVQRYEPPSVLTFSFVRMEGRTVRFRQSNSPTESLSFEGDFDSVKNVIVGTFDSTGFVSSNRSAVVLMPVATSGVHDGVFSNSRLVRESGDTVGYELLLFEVKGRRTGVLVDFENGGLPLEIAGLNVSGLRLTFSSSVSGTPEVFDGLFVSEGFRIRRRRSEMVWQRRGSLEEVFMRR